MTQTAKIDKSNLPPRSLARGVSSAKKKQLVGWYLFDWASQPYNTLLLTFIFAPYVKDLIGDGSVAQATWGFTVGAAALVMALLSPVLGTIADASGRRLPWIWLFSALYVIGSAATWYAVPGAEIWPILLLFALGLIGMEFATAFTNAMLPDLASGREIGRVSGTGTAIGYVGGFIALALALCFLADNPATGKTLIGLDPIFGLDAESREGTRIVGPAVALWFAIFMVPFFLFTKERRTKIAEKVRVITALKRVGRTISALPETPSLASFLGASMLYRDALSGMYIFGGIYAAGVMGWTIPQIGIFGIIAILASALSSWLGGIADRQFGSKAVVIVCIVILLIVSGALTMVSQGTVFGIQVKPTSNLPDVAFYVLGALIGSAGGALQASSRALMTTQAPREKMTEAFGLYALAGKATAFIAPMSIATVTAITDSQRLGILPLVAMLLAGLVLMRWVRSEGEV